MAEAPFAIVVADEPLGRSGAGGLTTAQTAQATIRPGSTLVQVGIVCYFKPSSPGGSVPGSGNTWSLYEGVRAFGGAGDVNLNRAVFSGRPLPDGWEVVTAAELLIVQASLSIPTTEAGEWRLRVLASLRDYVCPDLRRELLGSVRVEAPQTPLTLTAP